MSNLDIILHDERLTDDQRRVFAPAARNGNIYDARINDGGSIFIWHKMAVGQPFRIDPDGNVWKCY